jgi:hypothetical protein
MAAKLVNGAPISTPSLRISAMAAKLAEFRCHGGQTGQWRSYINAIPQNQRHGGQVG